jgi:hypothetical protein
MESAQRRNGVGLLGRSASTSLARREVLSPRFDSLGPGPRRGIVQLEGEDAESEVLTVILVPVVDATVPVPHGPCVAVVEWGNGSGTAVAEVDFAKGTVIQVAGSYLLVDGRNDGALPDGGQGDPDVGATTVDPNPGDQAVAVEVAGYGTRPPGRVTRTFYGRQLVRGEARTYPVPNFAKAVVVGRRPVAGTTIAVEIGDGVDGLSAGLRDGPHVANGAPAGRLDLYPLAGGVTVRNEGRAPVEAFQVVFELAL